MGLLLGGEAVMPQQHKRHQIQKQESPVPSALGLRMPFPSLLDHNGIYFFFFFPLPSGEVCAQRYLRVYIPYQPRWFMSEGHCGLKAVIPPVPSLTSPVPKEERRIY